LPQLREVDPMSNIEAILDQDADPAAETGAVDDSDYARAILNILNDAGDEQKSQSDSQRAMLNILEDLEIEKTRLESTQKALINMLDDLETERGKVDKTNI
jgi:hypothetical protein